MSIKITIPNSSSDVLTFGSGNTPTAAQIAGIDSGSSNGQLALYTTASGTSTEQARITSAGLLQFNSGYGSVATAYGCRAWVNFNGTGTVAITGSGNVSSLQDVGVGNYRINFTTAMPDANYALACIIGNNGTSAAVMSNGGQNGAGQAYLYTYNSSGTLADYPQCQFAVFR